MRNGTGKRRTLAMLILTLLICALLTACGGSSIVGKWAYKGDVYEFNADGTMTHNDNGWGFSGTYRTEGNTICITFEGRSMSCTFELNGDTLTIEDDSTRVPYERQK